MQAVETAEDLVQRVVERIDDVTRHLLDSYQRVAPTYGLGRLDDREIYALRAAVTELLADGVIT